MERHWYESLAAGSPDWGIYDGDEYLAEAWACWRVYSSEYLARLRRARVPAWLHPRTVTDLGCGIGWSTAALSRMFPRATVTGTNRVPSRQADIAARLRDRLDVTFTLAAAPGPSDLVLASEYFEHFPAPVAHLREILDLCQPKVLLAASTFTQPSAGHFPAYEVDGRTLTGPETSRRFSAELRSAGYRPRDGVHFWNNRPAWWERP